MSDDLISRKALLNRFKYSETDNETDKAWICTVRRIIKEQPTTFCKERVIEEILNISHGYYNVETENEIVEIIEKGGIE